MESTTVGIDLAKQLFSICVVDSNGRVVQRKELNREALAEWLVHLPAGTAVAMEACSSAHHWARVCRQHGLAPKLMAAQFVKPFRKSGAVKNDRNDAEAIATAARQGNMRFVSMKTVDQQARLIPVIIVIRWCCVNEDIGIVYKKPADGSDGVIEDCVKGYLKNLARPDRVRFAFCR